MSTRDTSSTIQAVWRIEQAKIIASLAAMVRDVELAEELAQDALVTALERWPRDGVPDNPAGWLMTTAKRRALDRLRRAKMQTRKHEELARDLDEAEEPDLKGALDDDVGDHMLSLIFTACHPLLSAEARTALTLRLIGGLTTEEIARAFLSTEPTIAQRIVRAKRTLSDAGVPFETPRGAERAERLSSVLEVLYLIFNEGYSATAGEDLLRPELCNEAMRLGRVLAGLTPSEPEVHGLVALMEIQASRLHARTDENGEPILLLDQNRARWDQLLIRRGLGSLERAEALINAHSEAPGMYVIQASIAACHARAKEAEDTDWARIASIYDHLSMTAPSPVVELNRAVAHGMAFGAEAGLAIADTLQVALKSYHLLPSVRGDLLFKLNRFDEARAEFERAAAMTRNERERELLLNRAANCSSG